MALTYRVASNVELQLDVYTPRNLSKPNPLVVYYHGGGWAGGSRDRAVLRLMPYLEMGFSVANVTYRGARIAPAPAAVEDCRCALLWVVNNAKKYNFDTSRIVLTGDSAGSHLALMSGLLTPGAGFDQACAPADAPPKVAAIVNWYGATDVADLLSGDHPRPFAVDWIGTAADGAALAKRVSPLTYAGAGSPPVLTIHGDADPVVPLNHASRLHASLTEHGVTNQLVTVAGAGHGDFTRQQNEANYAAIRAFLRKLNLLPQWRP